MDNTSLSCQVCLARFLKIDEIKKHLSSKMHKNKMKEVFQKDKFSSNAVPYIIMMDKKYTNVQQPIFGSSLLTFCFSPESKISFYLCHVCEEKCLPSKIASHLSSSNHCSNYFTYVNPNVMGFSWIPNMDIRGLLMQENAKDNKEKTNQLQILDLPKTLLLKLQPCAYSEVMQSLNENEKLEQQLKAVRPKRTTIQAYQKDIDRKHSLLGLQHIVECVCEGQVERRHYLCTLCKLSLTTQMVIKHILSFDHIYCYFNEYHPSTLLSKDNYSKYSKLIPKILNLVKQAEEAYGTNKPELKEVSLKPDEYTSVDFTCYQEALDKLESIRKEKGESSLTTIPKPEKKLALDKLESVRKEKEESSLTTVPAAEKKLESDVVSVKITVQVSCQNCGELFNRIGLYSRHLKAWKHREIVKNTFGTAGGSDGYEALGRIPLLQLYPHLTDYWKQAQPAVGVSLVVLCVSSQVHVEPICVCFACSDCFLESTIIQHLNSQKHIIHTLLYLNPWRLPLAWERIEDLGDLWLQAWREDRDREADEMMVKMLDLPYWVFQQLFPPCYKNVRKTLHNHIADLKCRVPKRETFSKTKGDGKFPLLGRQFLVKHYVCDRLQQPTEVAFLCMLCHRRLSHEECYVHVFSSEHITEFLNSFHPGSLNADTDIETLVDLAKQADSYHTTQNVQEIELDRSIWEPCSYKQAYNFLTKVKMTQGKGKLFPPIAAKQKLVPRKTAKDTEKPGLKEEPEDRSLQGSECESSQKSADCCDKKEVEAEITDPQCAEREEITEQKIKTEGPPHSGIISVKGCTEGVKATPAETYQTIKEEIKEEPITGTPNEEDMQPCSHASLDLKSESAEQSSQSVSMHSRKCREDANGPVSMCKNSQVGEEEEKKSREGEQPVSNHNTFSKETQGQREETSSEMKGTETISPRRCQQSVKALPHPQPDQLWQYLQRTSRRPVIGLSALVECFCDQRDPVYLCECCSVKIMEVDIISHVTGAQHQKKYLQTFKKLPRPQGLEEGMKLSQFAALLEKEHGYGEAQVLDLDEEMYNNVVRLNFKSAQEMVKTLQTRQGSVCEPSSASTQSTAQPMDTHAPPVTQPEASSQDDNQVVEMQIDDDSEDSEAEIPPETRSQTAEQIPDLSEGTKVTLVRKSVSVSKAFLSETVSRSSEEPSAAVLSSSGTNKSSASPGSTENQSKVEASKCATSSATSVPATTTICGTAKKSSCKKASINKTELGDKCDTSPACADSTTSNLKKSSTVAQTSSHTVNATATASANTSESTRSNSKKTSTTIPQAQTNISTSSTKKSSTCVASSSSSTSVTAKDEECAASSASTKAGTVKAAAVVTSTQCNTGITTATSRKEANVACKASTTTPSAVKKKVPAAITVAPPTSSGTTPGTSRKKADVGCKTSTTSASAVTSNVAAVSHSTSVAATSTALGTSRKKADVRCKTSTTSATAVTSNVAAVSHNTSVAATSTPLIKSVYRPAKTFSPFTCSTTPCSRESTASTPPPTVDSSMRGTTNASTSATSSATSTTTPEVSQPAAHKLNTKPNNASTGAISSLTLQSSEATEVKCGNTEPSGNTLGVTNSVGSAADVAPNTQSAAKTKSTIKLGVDYLIEVVCGKRRQLYCRLCAARLTRSGHPSSHRHKLNYVKLKYPGFTAESSELKSKLDYIVVHLAEIERNVGTRQIQRVDVKMDVYEELKGLPENIALRKVTDMAGQSDLRVSSSSPDAGEVWTPDTNLSSPFDSYSPDDEVFMWQHGTAGPLFETQSEQKNKLELQTPLEKTPVSGNEAVSKEEKNLDYAFSPVSDSPSLYTEASPSQETQEKATQQERSAPEIEEGVVLEPSEETSVKSSHPEQLSSSEAETDQQDQPRSSQRPEQVREQSESDSRPELHNSSQPHPRTSRWGPSHLSRYLTVKNMDPEAVTGLGSIWECRAILQNPFFLCESCSERIFINDICQHVVSDKHQLNHLLKKITYFTNIWQQKDLELGFKLYLLRETVTRLSYRERSLRIDAKCSLLPQREFEYVKTAPFNEALRFLQDYENEQECNFCLTSTSQQKDQISENQQDPAESVPTEVQSTQTPETDGRNKNGTKEETEEELLDGLTQTDTSSPPEETGFCPAVDSVVALSPDTGTRPSPEENLELKQEPSLQEETSVCPGVGPVFTPVSDSGTCSSPDKNSEMKQEPTPQPVEKHYQACTEVPVMQTEACSDSSSSSVVRPNLSPGLPSSTGGKSLLTRKRPADTPAETMATPCTVQPKFEDPSPAKTSALETTPSLFAPSPSNVPAKDQKSGPESKELNVAKKCITLDDLITLVNEARSEKKFPLVVRSETVTHCASNTSTGVLKVKRAHKLRENPSPVPEKKMKRTEGTWSPAHPSAGTGDPQNQESFAQSFSEVLIPSTSATNSKTESAAIPEPDSNMVSQLPISPIITRRPNLSKPQSTTQQNTRVYTEVNSQVTLSSSPAATAQSPVQSDAEAASAGYAHPSQMASATNGYTFYLPSGAAEGFTAPIYPAAYAQGSYQGANMGVYHCQQEASNPSLQALGHGAAVQTPDGWGALQMHQQHILHQQQFMHQQQVLRQQLIQQQYSWTNATMPAQYPQTNTRTANPAARSSWFFSRS